MLHWKMALYLGFVGFDAGLKDIFLESASEYRPVFFERNKRFSVSVMTLRHFGLSLIKNQAQWQSLLQIYKHAEC